MDKIDPVDSPYHNVCYFVRKRNAQDRASLFRPDKEFLSFCTEASADYDVVSVLGSTLKLLVTTLTAIG